MASGTCGRGTSTSPPHAVGAAKRLVTETTVRVVFGMICDRAISEDRGDIRTL